GNKTQLLKLLLLGGTCPTEPISQKDHTLNNGNFTLSYNLNWTVKKIIHGADYGRHDKTTCSDGRAASQLQVVQCSSPTSNDVVAKSCNGKNSCTIPASNSVFGDPCVGTYKYLEVVYTCQCNHSAHTVTCEGSQAKLQCGEFFFFILVIHRADYGRHDQTTCSNLQSDCMLRDVLCSSPESIKVVAESCNGKNSCTISATSSVFGNPCFGTYKYLEVDYTCQCKYLKQ
uniref:SUEL-type lectin domain-containing protein n=1 Tax=Oreochromis aureus TaxID=47969 RepID=A0A668UCC9_OREAU